MTETPTAAAGVSNESETMPSQIRPPKLFSFVVRFSPVLVLIPILVYAVAGGFGEESNFRSVLAVCLMVAAASFIVGGLTGFLFGLPRTLERPDAKAFLATNSNLDQVSDWLTKILLGLGLVQLGSIADGVDGMATSIASAIGGGPGAETFALGILIYAAVDGFLLGYLWTRVVLSIHFKNAAEALATLSEINQVLATPTQAPPREGPPPPPPAAPSTSEQGASGQG